MFKFRLQKLLAHRQRQEEEAKRLYLERKAAKIAGEQEIAKIRSARGRLGEAGAPSLSFRLDLMDFLTKTYDDEKAANIALDILLNEEGAAEGAWIESKRELQKVEKLREKSFEEWQYEDGRKVQNALDEWAALRRAA
jgi:flagellar export protein FliJ